MDIQRMLDAISDALRDDRLRYHLTLGQLAAICEQHPDAEVMTDTDESLGTENSYRGYYADLAFTPSGPQNPRSTASEVLQRCQRALTETYTGYKGGDFTYGEDTPLWLAPYGCCGPAIVAARYVPAADLILLTTKEID